MNRTQQRKKWARQATAAELAERLAALRAALASERNNMVRASILDQCQIIENETARRAKEASPC